MRPVDDVLTHCSRWIRASGLNLTARRNRRLSTGRHQEAIPLSGKYLTISWGPTAGGGGGGIIIIIISSSSSKLPLGQRKPIIDAGCKSAATDERSDTVISAKPLLCGASVGRLHTERKRRPISGHAGSLRTDPSHTAPIVYRNSV
jgi:hypothetical protein